MFTVLVVLPETDTSTCTLPGKRGGGSLFKTGYKQLQRKDNVGLFDGSRYCTPRALMWWLNAEIWWSNTETWLAKFGDAVSKFGDAVSKFGDAASKFGDAVSNFGDVVNKCGDMHVA